ncbi:alpha/beta fold hydrolase [Kibdelosporangium phytohabitans]|uniref:Transporter n=1 Tax=Kibdelosporangium phytohabitans TaxID=860235 RepID=A0A0N9HW15_9PSEU|nr:alpha/beta fold hydrolase [Kibdelosporangium phytohabitans]ALG07234.1 transporter [Kibdelosporangium phytohabitans]MBE1471911.1 pimeloyl-ACP methyl ester carboxylesterase [Kibdelosporangium phytohabitans]
MRPLTRAFGVTLASAALLGAVVTSAGADPDDSPVSTVDWKPCPDDAALDCGSLKLPIDYRRPGGATFDLALARRKAADPARRLGALLVDPGGPGGSGVDFVTSPRHADYFSEDVKARFDIVGFDPRGVARSQPVMCSAQLLTNPPTNRPATQAEFDALIEYNRALRVDCRRRSGPIADFAGNDSTIQDMDAIRRALGEKKINYYGISYGTLMGQQYAERYGDKVRAMVLDSNMDHSLGPWPIALTEARSAQSSFDEWVKWCGRSTSCALHGKDVRAFWHTLLAKADRGELPDGLTARDVIASAFGAFYGPAWQELSDYLVQLDGGVNSRPSSPAVKDEQVNDVFQAAFCADYAMPIHSFAEYKALEKVEDKLAPDMRGGVLGHSAIAGCFGLEESVTNPQRRLNIKNAPRIYMLNALYDPATPYEWAVNAHRQSKDTTELLTYEGWGHGVYGRSECTTAPIDQYLVSTKVPSVRRCEAVEPSAPTAHAARPLPVGPRPGVPGWLR